MHIPKENKLTTHENEPKKEKNVFCEKTRHNIKCAKKELNAHLSWKTGNDVLLIVSRMLAHECKNLQLMFKNDDENWQTCFRRKTAWEMCLDLSLVFSLEFCISEKWIAMTFPIFIRRTFIEIISQWKQSGYSTSEFLQFFSWHKLVSFSLFSFIIFLSFQFFFKIELFKIEEKLYIFFVYMERFFFNKTFQSGERMNE